MLARLKFVWWIQVCMKKNHKNEWQEILVKGAIKTLEICSMMGLYTRLLERLFPPQYILFKVGGLSLERSIQVLPNFIFEMGRGILFYLFIY